MHRIGCKVRGGVGTGAEQAMLRERIATRGEVKEKTWERIWNLNAGVMMVVMVVVMVVVVLLLLLLLLLLHAPGRWAGPLCAQVRARGGC